MNYFLNNPTQDPDRVLKISMSGIPYIRYHIGPAKSETVPPDAKVCAFNLIFFHGNSETIFCAMHYMKQILTELLRTIQGTDNYRVHLYLYMFEYPFYTGGSIRLYSNDVIEEWINKVNYEFYVDISETKVHIPESYAIAIGYSVGAGFASRFMKYSNAYISLFYFIAPFSSVKKMVDIHCSKIIGGTILNKMFWKSEYNYFNVVDCIHRYGAPMIEIDHTRAQTYIMYSDNDAICGQCAGDFKDSKLKQHIQMLINVPFQHVDFFSVEANKIHVSILSNFIFEKIYSSKQTHEYIEKA